MGAHGSWKLKVVSEPFIKMLEIFNNKYGASID